jgi:hypothetical protein
VILVMLVLSPFTTNTNSPNSAEAVQLPGVGVDVGGTGVDVDVGGTGVDVDVGGTGVDVDVGGTGVDVDVGGTGVGVDVGGAGVPTLHPTTNRTTDVTEITDRNNIRLIFLSFHRNNQPPNREFYCLLAAQVPVAEG